MTEQWTVPAWAVVAGAVVAVALVLLVALCLLQVRRVARRADARAAALSDEVAGLAAAAAAARQTGPHEAATEHPSYVITQLGEEPETSALVDQAVAPVATLPPGAFADVVLREGALRSASLLHGVRRALAPETRSRIRAEMRREVKRQRKTRRLEHREALRAWQTRQREQEPAA